MAAKKAEQLAAKKRADEERKVAAAAKKAEQLAAKKKAEEERKAAVSAKAQQSAKKQQAQQTVTQAKKGATISLFGIGQKQESAPAPAPAPAPAKKQQQKSKPVAPRGVPTVSPWKLNGDGSISGVIRGSPNFRDGERITTSPIAQGRIESGAVVKTGSGSQYFLG